ncbi:hypothetical protein [Exiguobacterium sp. s160]|uniref:hypothetical protein n=1 Tax=Exiguobacterium sp. s160 TaxID=2751265 RepID=UPI001BE72EDC|nr:hypothetical protein [Exiguobacterium sp. s160]
MKDKTFRTLYHIPPSFVEHPLQKRVLQAIGRPQESMVEVIFRVGGFGTYDVSTITFFERGTVLRHIERSDRSITEPFEFEYYEGDEAKQMRVAFHLLGTNWWPTVFEELEGVRTLDGTQWNLSVYANGKLIHEHSGSNAYPDQWRQLTQLFCIS